MNDLKFAFRQLLKNPGFTALAVLTLALGIGANTAVFSFLDYLLIRALPVERPHRLVTVATQLELPLRRYADRSLDNCQRFVTARGRDNSGELAARPARGEGRSYGGAPV